MNAPQTPLVIKVGGRALEQVNKLTDLWHNVLAAQAERPCILVHGGGSLIDNWLETFQRSTSKSAGQRLTKIEDMPIIAGALSGALNTQLVACINAQYKLRDEAPLAVGCGLGDANWCALIKDEARGQVGIPSIEKSSARYLQFLLDGNYLPVVHSVGTLQDGSLANVNADLAAASIAALLNADLLLLTDVDAILDHQGQALHSVTAKEAHELIATQVVQGGMQVKLEAALQAASVSRRSTAVAAWYTRTPFTALIDPRQDGLATHIIA